MIRKKMRMTIFPLVLTVVLFSFILSVGCSKSLDNDDFEKISIEYLKAASDMKEKGEASPEKLEQKLKEICEQKGSSLAAYKEKAEKIGKEMTIMTDDDFKKIEELYVKAEIETKAKVEEQAKEKERDKKAVETEIKKRMAIRLKEICIANGYKLIDYKVKNEELFQQILAEYSNLEKEFNEGNIEASEKDRKLEEICSGYGFSSAKFKKMIEQQKTFDEIVNNKK